MSLERGPLLANDKLTGAPWCTAHAQLVDAWLARLVTDAAQGRLDGLALVAVGGYGRAELCPQSDIDVYLIHAGRSDAAAVAERVWYPVWDESLHLGHSVCTVRQALGLASDDVELATALLSARHIAGDDNLTAALAKGGLQLWERKSRRWLGELGARVAARHDKAGEVAFLLEPDLKEGRGGLRDAHALAWAEAAHRIMLDHDETALSQAYSVLLGARVELQRHTRRSSNVLTLEAQAAVAHALGLADEDALMLRVAEAARTIAWTSDDTWRRIRSALRGPLGRVARRNRVVDADIVMRDGEISVTESAVFGGPTLVLRAAAAAAANHTVIERGSLERLAARRPAEGDTWPADARAALIALLLSGRAAITVVEALDQRGIWGALLPEWRHVRARPQRNPYHRYTVDRHLLETVANAAKMAGRVDRADLLVVAALLHDIGKGLAGDHTHHGMALARGVAVRIGLAPEDVETIVALVEHHLLLPEVATRRDLDDPTTVQRVADRVGSPQLLDLLAALAEADGLATGPAAWGPWKAELVARLVNRVEDRMRGVEGGTLAGLFPTEDQLARLAGLAGGRSCVEADGSILTVMAVDRPGVFSRIAGVVALHGLDVVAAAAHSTEGGRALAVFTVVDPFRDAIPWDRVKADVHRALDGRLAVSARLAERARTYRRRGPATRPAATQVHFDIDASTAATVIDVHTTDGIGVLYRITRALAELDLDIRSARVHTLGGHVVDAFYVRDAIGAKITDPVILAEIERAVVHGLDT
ncbi:MAG TPA: [protein-PII] uridylyltransferase [Acidimicrobiales bacterium]